MKERDACFKRGMAMLKKMGREKTMMDQKALDPDLYDLSVGHPRAAVMVDSGAALPARRRGARC